MSEQSQIEKLLKNGRWMTSREMKKSLHLSRRKIETILFSSSEIFISNGQSKLAWSLRADSQKRSNLLQPTEQVAPRFKASRDLLNASGDYSRILVVDFETTGLKRGYQPVEVAWLEIDINFRILERVHALINPLIAIEPGAQMVHGISFNEVENEPSIEEFIVDIHKDKFRDEHVLFIAHNATYDLQIFSKFCSRVTPLCTMKLARRLYPEAPNHKLLTLAEMFGIKVDNSHRALADVTTCFEVLCKIADATCLDLPGLIDVNSSDLYRSNESKTSHQKTETIPYELCPTCFLRVPITGECGCGWRPADVYLQDNDE